MLLTGLTIFWIQPFTFIYVLCRSKTGIINLNFNDEPREWNILQMILGMVCQGTEKCLMLKISFRSKTFCDEAYYFASLCMLKLRFEWESPRGWLSWGLVTTYGVAHDVLPNGTKRLPGSMLPYHQSCSVALNQSISTRNTFEIVSFAIDT